MRIEPSGLVYFSHDRNSTVCAGEFLFFRGTETCRLIAINCFFPPFLDQGKYLRSQKWKLEVMCEDKKCEIKHM